LDKPDFAGLRVLVLESRRATEMASLVTTYGGTPIVAPSMREVPLESNTAVLGFADALIAGTFQLVILLTGVGTRALLDVVQNAGMREPFVDALRRTKVVPRGPKPMSVLRELNVPAWVTVPEPNTWRELLAAIDAAVGRALPGSPRGPDKVRATEPASLDGLHIAVQEYGASPVELLEGLDTRGAKVTRVPVYRWALPEDLGPLQAAIGALARGEVDVALFTTATQLVHLLQVARSMQQADAVRQGLAKIVVASIGPTTSEELRHEQVSIDLEASHPKMGFLVREAAGRARELLASKPRM
jgi:uroporphyrinogen-III synthase